MRALACVAAVAAVACSASGAAAPSAACPGGHGFVRYVRGAVVHEVSLATCADRVVAKSGGARGGSVASPDRQVVATVRSTGNGRTAKETIWITDRRAHARRAVFVESEYYKEVTGRESPGPIELLRLSDDGRWLFFTIDPDSSASIAADGLILRVVPTKGGAVHELGVMLTYPDYLIWCGGRLVWVGGPDRVAIHAKRLLEATPPDWRPRALWADPARSVASPACAPDGRSLALLSQRSSVDANFFHTRWRLWRVGLDGSKRLLDTPPRASADEQPVWSQDGRSIAFVRERYGHGSMWVWQAGRIRGPYAQLGYELGYYGHHDWGLAWRP